MKRTKILRGKWFDRAGESYQLLMTDAVGPRVDVHRWHDTNEVIVRAIVGDGRKPDEFREFSSKTLQAPTDSELAAAENEATQMLRHIGVLHAVIADCDDRLFEVGLDPLWDDQKDCLIQRRRFQEAREMIEMMRDFGYLSETLLGRLIRAHADLHGVVDPALVSSWPK